MKKSIVLTFGLVLGFFSQSLFGQVKAQQIQEIEAPVVVEGFPIGGIDFAEMIREMSGGISKEFKDKLALRLKARAREKIALRIEFLDRVCKLDPKQKKRLGFVAKGVVQKSVNEIVGKIPVQKQKADQNAVPAAKLQVAKDAGAAADQGNFEVVGAPQIFQAAGGQMVLEDQQVSEILFLLEDLSSSGQVLNLQKHPLWKKQLSRILRKDQVLALRKEQETRRKKRRAIAIAFTVSVLSSDLLLSEHQQKKLAELIHRKYRKVVDQSLENSMQFGSDLTAIILTRSDKELLGILTAAQQNILKRKIRMLGGFAMPGGVAFPGGGISGVEIGEGVQVDANDLEQLKLFEQRQEKQNQLDQRAQENEIK